MSWLVSGPPLVQLLIGDVGDLLNHMDSLHNYPVGGYHYRLSVFDMNARDTIMSWWLPSAHRCRDCHAVRLHLPQRYKG